jgi:hypothetical protein
MSPEVALAAIPAILAAIGSLISIVASIRNGRKIESVEIRLDGRLEELIERTRESSHAAGVVAGIAQQKVTGDVVAMAAGVAENVVEKAATVAADLVDKARK